ncbi:hypothetical protein BR93DRAFT_971834 [Coniochaeta sp. PMI_546]|nr:hypothetical protein BR93DRAFT_971834 [Coniochaeta sp. PMI_546]
MAATSLYEVTLTDQLPPSCPKTTRITARLSQLPVELVEPIIQDLPLFRVLELTAVPSCGPSLIWAIEHSPTWSWLFKGHIWRLRRVWASLNRLSWLWCHTHYINIKTLPHYFLCLKSPEFQKWHTWDAENARQALDNCVILGVRRILGCDLYTVRPGAAKQVYFGFSIPQIRALCLFLPSTLLSAIKKRDFLGFQHALYEAKMPQNSRDCLAEGENMALDLSSGDLSRRDLWTVESAHRFLPFLVQAHKLLKESYCDELLSVAKLYDEFPGKLKLPFAPQAPPSNKTHVAERLRRDAEHILTKPLRTPSKVFIHPHSKEVFRSVKSYRFRSPDTALVPYDWCFILFEAVRRKYPLSFCSSRYPEALLPALREAEAGIRMIYHRNPGRYIRLLERVDDNGMPNTERLKATLGKNTEYAPFLHYVSGPPRPLRELSWLRSFLACVQWMEKLSFPLASACKGLGECDTRFNFRDLADDALFPPPDYEKFVSKAPAELIASCMLRDFNVCGEEGVRNPTSRPTLLARHLPDSSSPRGRDIAKYLVPCIDVGIEIQQLRYDSLKHKLTRYLQNPGKLKSHNDGYRLSCDLTDKAEDDVAYPNNVQASTCAASTCADISNNVPRPRLTEVTQSDVDVASKVPRHLLECSPDPSASVANTLDLLRELSISTAAETAQTSQKETGQRRAHGTKALRST